MAPAVGGLFLGAVVGMASALLLAPQSTERLRSALRGMASDAKALSAVPDVETA